jgi:Domain of unknown function (DUF4337)
VSRMAEVEIPNTEELADIRGKRFTKRVALTTAIFAVVLAITSLGGNNATKEMILAQQQSSDQWAFYQSKVVRQHLYNIERLRIEAELLQSGASMKPKVREKYEATLKKTSDEEKRYDAERKQIEQAARGLEHERDRYRAKDPYFDYAEALLQISIVMASISILAVSRHTFYFALATAGLGTAFMLNGYLLLFRIPFFH